MPIFSYWLNICCQVWPKWAANAHFFQSYHYKKNPQWIVFLNSCDTEVYIYTCHLKRKICTGYNAKSFILVKYLQSRVAKMGRKCTILPLQEVVRWFCIEMLQSHWINSELNSPIEHWFTALLLIVVWCHFEILRECDVYLTSVQIIYIWQEN